ncbi:hypothetical protein AU467_35050 [Mesorhizobium loti]|uniref:Uncharacterized protein n=1 Tax=Rhizobium loti TaxID=381 RepID=A0A101KW54_RHILI|nr:hypothetical protein AU467_35050 [Mesorhizobium loti]
MQRRQPRQPSYRQPDLFVAEFPRKPLSPERQKRLLPLIGALLKESASTPPARETDDEDHG